jgi:small-conductance mechanosensitive channel
MKPFNNNDNIDKYYDKTLNTKDDEAVELKQALDRMTIIEKLDQQSLARVEVSKAVGEGLKLRDKKKLRRETFKFLLVAFIIAAFIGFIYTKLKIEAVFISQIGLLIILLVLNYILIKRKVRRGA